MQDAFFRVNGVVSLYNMEEQTSFAPEPPPQPLKPMFFGEERIQPLSQRLLWFAGSVGLSWLLLYFLSRSWQLATGITGIFLVHELGHLLAMWFFGFKGLRMVFIPLLGAFVSGKRSRSVQSQEIIVSLAGPVPGLVLASVLLVLPLDIPRYGEYLIFIAIFINALNLLPFQPLDGGRVMNMLMGRQDGMYTIIMHASVLVLSVILVLKTGSFFWGLLGFMAVRMAMSEWKALPARRKMLADGVDFQQNYNELSDQEFMRLRRYLPLYDASFGYIDQYTWAEIPPEQRRSEELGLRSLLQEPVNYNLSLAGQLLVSAVWILAFALPIIIIGPQELMQKIMLLFGLQ
jgi:stage IV sporulation protein FB